MSELFLRNVEFSNFRIYGDSYSLSIPPCPGVTLITGANGLGKTSFFDGIEWALTGQVSRFLNIMTDGRKKKADPLTRLGASEDSHRVSLQFSDGAPIDRGAGFVPEEADIIRLLKQPDWSAISNLDGYLSITHFLGQASTQRFSQRKPDDQWEALRGPAGVDRINALRERMNGQGVRRAFTRAIDDRTKQLDLATKALRDWQELLEERGQARQLATSDQAVSPSEVSTTVEALAKRILEFAPDTWEVLLPTHSAETRLERLSFLILEVEESIGVEVERANSLSKLVFAYDVARDETVLLDKLAAEIEIRKAANSEALSKAETTVLAATEAVAACERQAAQVQIRSVALTRIATASRQLTAAHGRHTEALAQIERLDALVIQAQHRLEQFRARLDGAIAQRAGRRALAERVTMARKRAQIANLLAESRAQIERLAPLAAASIATDLGQRSDALGEQAAAADKRISSVTASLRQHDDRRRALAEAVSAIAHRIGHDDVYCPVCASTFPPGRLAELVSAQLASDATPVSELADALADAKRDAENFRNQIAVVQRELMELDRVQSAISNQRAREEELRQQLVEAGGAPDADYSESEVLPLEAELAALDDQLTETEAPETLTALIEECESTLNAETSKRAAIQRIRDGASEEMATARSTLQQRPEIWSPEKGLLIAVDEEQAEIERLSQSIGEQIASGQASLSEARVRRDRLQEAVTRDSQSRNSANVRRDVVSEECQDLARRWTEAGQTGEPSTSRLEQYSTQLAERAVRLASFRGMHQKLVDGYRKWLSDEHLRSLEKQVASRMREDGAESEQAHYEMLVTREEAARRELVGAQRARDRIAEVADQMQEKAEMYAHQVLAPLNETIERFANALMTGSDASIRYRAEHHVTRSALRSGIVRREADGKSTQLDLHPHHYFSEGQLSALSVAALLAASTTFGWSRWRGLLLDDPLQHNDVIHASAFMDLIRQMVRKLRYQVILSTHDSNEAEFLRRKCLSADIPCHTHVLRSRGPNGLVLAPA